MTMMIPASYCCPCKLNSGQNGLWAYLRIFCQLKTFRLLVGFHPLLYQGQEVVAIKTLKFRVPF